MSDGDLLQIQDDAIDIAGTIASLQDQASTDILSAKTYVAGDYALLSTVGQLVGSDVWKFDKNGYLSLSRYAFTVWVMQQLLPTVWEIFAVSACDQNNFYVQCLPPPNGSNMALYTTYRSGYGIDFTGILEKEVDDDDPCAGSMGGQTVCEWTAPPQGLQDFVFSPLPSECKYSPGATGWVYPTPNSKGCSLGAASDIFHNANGWNFEVRLCPLDVTGDCDDPISAGPRPRR